MPKKVELPAVAMAESIVDIDELEVPKRGPSRDTTYDLYVMTSFEEGKTLCAGVIDDAAQEQKLRRILAMAAQAIAGPEYGVRWVKSDGRIYWKVVKIAKRVRK